MYKRQGDFLLDSVSLSAMNNDIIGLIGDNGAGKTTFLKIIASLISIDSGESNLPLQEKIGVVFDQLPFPGSLSIYELEKVMKRLFSTWEAEKFHNYINLFKLPLKTPVKKFSKGMSMKLNIAVSLSHQAQILLLDELTSGLDPLVRIDILQLIQDYVRENNATVVMSTHILDDIDKIATKVVLMHNGKFVLQKEMKDIPDMHYLEKKFKEILEKQGEN
nr:ABC transporter ATP-binding protein [Alkalibacterium olivapovliticus]